MFFDILDIYSSRLFFLILASMILDRNISKTVRNILDERISFLLARLIRRSIIANDGLLTGDAARVLAHDDSQERSDDLHNKMNTSEGGTKLNEPNTMEIKKDGDVDVDHVAKIKSLPNDPKFKEKIFSRSKEGSKRRLGCEITNCRTSFKCNGLVKEYDGSSTGEKSSQDELQKFHITFNATMEAKIIRPTTLNVELNLSAPGTITGKS